MLASLLLILVPVQQPDQVPADQVPADAPFRWSAEAEVPGPARLDDRGWSRAGDLSHREVPGWAGAATHEVLLAAPASGDATRSERALVQLPELEPGARAGALVIAFHGFGRSEREVFLETNLPAECARRGWVLVAPYGLTDTNFASQASQRAVGALLSRLHDLAPHDPRRVYAVGFSMGGLTALSFAMRHQDPRGLRVAGVVCHSPTLDLEQTFARGRAPVRRDLIEQFGGPPRAAPFAYARISPARFLPSGLVDPGAAPIVQLEGVPIFLHINLADPDPRRVEQVFELRRFLVARGAQVIEDLAFAPEDGHRWGTLPLVRALDVVGAHASVGVPRRLEVFADRPGRYGPLEVRSLSAEAHGRARVLAAPGELELHASAGLEQVAFDLPLAGIDPGRPLTLSWSSADGSGDQVALGGYQRVPARVTYDGQLAPPRTWSWDERSGEVRLVLSMGALSPGALSPGAPVKVRVSPSLESDTGEGAVQPASPK
jgi:pimeloyl-ACP methyl ester carboxylesterase